MKLRLNRRAFLLALVFLGLLCASADAQPKQVTITLLGTTDLHSNVYPIDYYANRATNRGLAKIATLIRQVRAERGGNVLLLDSGDTIQGTPLAYYYARRDTKSPNPTIAMMNALRYDAMAVGNHEFNFGLDVLWKAKSEAKFPWLAANVRQTYKDPRRTFGSYIIKNVGGVRVGILGFITPGVPRWEIPAHYEGYQFDDIVETAKRIVPALRKKVDLLVVIAHSGLERGAQAGGEVYSDIRGENVMGALADQVPQIDVILFGHSHRELPERTINGVLLTQARNWGQSLARADVVMERAARGRWKVASKKSTVLPVTDAVAADAEILALAKRYHDTTQAYLDKPAATSPRAMDGATARYEDHPFVDLIHKVQLEYGKADVSLATLLLPAARVPAGQITVRQLAAIYIYENTLYTIEMTGAQLRKALEVSAGNFTSWPLKEGERPRLPSYNADCAEGVSYVVDLTQPPGQRIRDLTYQGRPLAPDEKLRVATNNYRYAGGGSYGLNGLPILFRSGVEIRDLLIEYVQRAGTIPAEANQNWKIVPRDAAEAMIAEAQRRDAERAAPPAEARPR